MLLEFVVLVATRNITCAEIVYILAHQKMSYRGSRERRSKVCVARCENSS